ncbi:MAG: CDP-archaeol synthase [Planctomycetaceae bacterium]|nr:CDP-archaeol synthase [Planctomycetaceae bacterium]
MLGWRLLMSCILLPSLVAFFWLDQRLGNSGWVLLGLCSFIAVRNSFELVDLLKTRSLKPVFPLCAVLSLLVVIAGWGQILLPQLTGSTAVASPLLSLGFIGSSIVLSFLVLLVAEAIRYEQPGSSMESLGAHVITVLYAGGLLAVTAQMRWFPRPELGYFAMASMIVCVKCGDTFAYTFGRLWGKKKMAPKLSPGKTWMGLVGAIVGSTVGGLLWLSLAGRMFDAAPKLSSIANGLAYGAVLGLVGLAGDLCESLIKRDVQKKDSAALMPGFGGLLDLLDSPLFTGPIALAWWVFLPPAV